jgi:hypothetical protein
VYGQTRLLDYYEDRMSLRELLNRLLALPHDCPFWAAMRDQQEAAAAVQRADDLDDVLNRYRKG